MALAGTTTPTAAVTAAAAVLLLPSARNPIRRSACTHEESKCWIPPKTMPDWILTFNQSQTFQQKLKRDIFSIIALSIKAFTKVKEHQYV